MSSAAEIGTFKRLCDELMIFARENEGCEIDHLSEKAILVRFGEGDRRSLLDASPGLFDLTTCTQLGLSNHLLRDERDVDQALALCDAVMAGRGVTVSGPGGYPVRSWFFLESRGLRATVTTTATSIRSCRRARSIPKSAFTRERLPNLTNKVH
ncbi:MAG: hypothetical protein V7678_14125 [Brevundimonas sp.]